MEKLLLFTMKKVLLFAVIALALSTAFYYFNNMIKASWADALYEIGAVAVILFIFLLIAFILVKVLNKTAVAIKKNAFRNGRQ